MQAALVILDGWGLSDRNRRSGDAASDSGSSDRSKHRDAVQAADTPNFDRFAAAGAYGTLDVSGRRVGLPDGQMGNSEVGHLNIGAGRVVKQAYTRINDSVEDGSFVDNEAIGDTLEAAVDEGGRAHFMGLVSEGGVHSDQKHLYALVELAAEQGLDAVTHAFTDGRDTDPRSGVDFLADLQRAVDDHGTGDVATVSGRYYAMDRDKNWERTKRTYDAIVRRVAEHEAPTAVDAVRKSYERGDTDEFVEPTLIEGGPGLEAGDNAERSPASSRPALRDGDAVVFFNFRSDRARQLVRMLADIDPDEWGFETSPPDVHFVTMTQYDETFPLPVAFPPNQPEDTLGEVLANAGKTQLRIAESEKYAHVTYFLNGGREVEFEGEIRHIVESPDVPTYDLQPEMSAPAVTDTAVGTIESDDPDVLVLNYANPDMVGHTGDFEAAVAAVEAVDEQLGRLVTAVRGAGGHVLVTADHGNADDMGTEEEPHTAHTHNPVPFVYLTPGDSGDVGAPAGGATGDGAVGGAERPLSGGKRVRAGGSLCDLAPTLLELVGIERPEPMTGESLLE